jgi:tRNA pseudouridine synthase 10
MNILDDVSAILSEHRLCRHCLGRLFGGLSGEMTNLERGEALITTLTLSVYRDVLEDRKGDIRLAKRLVSNFGITPLEDLLLRYGHGPVENSTEICDICQGKLREVQEIADLIRKDLADFEFRTFHIGTIVPSEIERKEDEIRSRFHLKYSENIKNEFSREIGKIIENTMTDKTYSRRPDVRVEVNPYTREISFFSKKILVEGDVEILDEDAPVFAKVCPACAGGGCEKCGFTGKEEGESFEYEVGKRLIEMARGRQWKFGMTKKDDQKMRFRISLVHPERRPPVEELPETMNPVLQNRFRILTAEISE